MMQNGSEEGDGLTTNGCLSSSGLGPIHVTVNLVRTSYEQPSLETHTLRGRAAPTCLPPISGSRARFLSKTSYSSLRPRLSS